MSGSTTNHGIGFPEAADLVKDPATPSKLAADIRKVAVGADNALAVVESRAKVHADDLDRINRTDWATALAGSLAESKEYTDVSFEASGPGGATDAQVDAAVDRGVLGGRVADPAKLPEGGVRSVGKGELVTNIRDYGATGVESQDAKAALEAAIAATAWGGTVLCPSGTYFSGAVGNEGPSRVKVEKPIKFVGEPGTVFKGVRFWFTGSAEPLKPITAAIDQNDRNITINGHGLVRGDYVQLFSEYNAYTEDAGNLQMGSHSPLDDSLARVRATEIQKVMSTPTANDVELLIPTRYRYGTTTPTKFPIEGVTGSESRRLNMLEGITFDGIVLDYTGTTRGILMRKCANVRFIDCEFLGGTGAGSHLQATDCYNIQFIRTNGPRSVIDSDNGSLYNSILIGGGCTFVSFEGGTIFRQAQAIDTITNVLDSVGEPGGERDLLRADCTTVQDVHLREIDFQDCRDGFTSHPATYGVRIDTCNFRSSVLGAGLRLRSRRNQVVGCTFDTVYAGIVLQGFFHDTMITGCTFRHMVSPEYVGAWVGIMMILTNAETMSDNRLAEVFISNNRFIGKLNGQSNWGIDVRHGTTTGSRFNNDMKARLSDFTFSANHFEKCSIHVGPWVNGTDVVNNQFRGGSDQAAYIVGDTGAAKTMAWGNTFEGTSPTGLLGIKLGDKDVEITYPYDAYNRIGRHSWILSQPAMSLANSLAMIESAGIA